MTGWREGGREAGGRRWHVWTLNHNPDLRHSYWFFPSCICAFSQTQSFTRGSSPQAWTGFSPQTGRASNVWKAAPTATNTRPRKDLEANGAKSTFPEKQLSLQWGGQTCLSSSLGRGEPSVPVAPQVQLHLLPTFMKRWLFLFFTPFFSSIDLLSFYFPQSHVASLSHYSPCSSASLF